MNDDLKVRYTDIQRRIRAAAASESAAREITLVAVSKKQSVDAIEALYQLGHRDFGENYAQEFVSKAETLKQRGLHDIRWHFIGHLQSNKVKAVLPAVSVIHSVDSEKLGIELAKRWSGIGDFAEGISSEKKKLPIFLEVNIDQEPTKAGLSVAQVPQVARVLSELPELEILGLMCIPDGERGPAGDAFDRLAGLEALCRPWTKGKLSMGMTQDFESAIQKGASHIRVGTALFGARNST